MSRERAALLAAVGIPLVLFAAVFAWLDRPPKPHPEIDEPAARAQAYFYEDIYLPYFRVDAAKGVYVAQRPGSSAQPFPVAKSSDTFRVFIVGGSIAEKFGGGGRVPALQVELERLLPRRRIEVVNCGMGGYESFREEMLIDELLGYAPDAIVLFSAQNEGIGSPPVALWRLRLIELVTRWGLAPDVRRRLLSRTPNASPRIQAAINATFQTNLARMARTLRLRGVPFVVALPPLNYRDHPKPKPLSPYDAELVDGWLRYVKGDLEGALAAWDKALPSMDSGQASFARFWMGRANEALSRWAEAERRFYEAFDDPSESRAGPARLAMMRATASEGGALVANVDATFRGRSAPRMPGLDLFMDQVHWMFMFNDLAALPVVKALRGDPALSGMEWDDAALARTEAAIREHGTLPDNGENAPSQEQEALDTLRHALFVLTSDGEAPSWESVDYLQSLLARYPSWFADLDKLAATAESGPGGARHAWGTPALKVKRPSLDWHLGEVWLLEHQPKKALAFLRRAVEADPRLTDAWASRAVAAALSGERQEAEASLREFEKAHRSDDALRRALSL